MTTGPVDGRPGQVLFVVGSPRSGTTWLQLLLGHHPAVSTANETHLFSEFLGPMLRSWERLEDSERAIGLSTVFSRRRFVDRLRSIAEETIDGIEEDGCRLVVEKTPAHAVWGDEILEIFPEARIVHLLRDPRDVVASLLAASREWGGGWAPGNAYDAARWWREHVVAARSIRASTDRFYELTYEDLYADPEAELGRLLEWTGLEASRETLRSAVEETRLSRMREGETEAPWELEEEPDGFVRKGGSGNWRVDLTGREARVVEQVNRDLMHELGYDPHSGAVASALAALPYRVRDRVRDFL